MNKYKVTIELIVESKKNPNETESSIDALLDNGTIRDALDAQEIDLVYGIVVKTEDSK